MSEENTTPENQVKQASEKKKGIRGYGHGTVETVLSVDAVAEEAKKLAADAPKPKQLDDLVEGDMLLSINNLRAGYGQMEILHDFDLRVGRGQSLCLIGPNGAGKSTILHSIYGFTNIFDGKISVNGKDVTKLGPNDKLKTAGIAYILQDNSVFPDMTVEENLLMGGFLMDTTAEAHERPQRCLKNIRA